MGNKVYNQILVSEKVYVTRQMKNTKKTYQIFFIFSVFVICTLFSFYIYAEYDRSKNEKISKEILAQVNFEDKGEISLEESQIIVILNDEEDINEQEQSIIPEEEFLEETKEVKEFKSASGDKYTIIGTINIPSIKVNYPIISKTTNELLKISPCKFWGPNPNTVGNFCIVGHNYRNSKFFSKVPNLEEGNIIEITDDNNLTLNYMVYDKYIVEDTDTSCTSQLTSGRKEVTIITCTNDSKQRVIVKAKEI